MIFLLIMNIKQLLSLKTKYTVLDENIINSIINMMNESNIESNKIKKINKLKKINDFNIILNKISETNYKEIIKDFFNSIIITNDKIKEFCEIFFNKIINDTTFIMSDSLFFIDLIKGLHINYPELNQNILLEYIEYFFIKLYKENFNEIQRKNYLQFLYNLSKLGLFKENLLIEITEFILNLTNPNYFYDIYIWFIINKNLLKIKKYIKLLNNKIDQSKNNKRNETLIKSLFFEEIEEKEVKYKKEKKIIKNTIDGNNIEIENLIEEFLILEDKNEIKLYIEEECLTPKNKNNFCYIILKILFKKNKSNINKLLNLLDFLIYNKTLFKSNLSRGLINYYKNENNINIIIIKYIILFLKKKNITNGIEFIIQKFND